MSSSSQGEKSNRRSFPRRRTKQDASPQKPEELDAAGDGNASVMTDKTLSYRWVDGGADRKKNGTIEHTTLKSVVNGVTSLIRVGDSILLNSGDDDDAKDRSKIYKNDSKDYYANGGDELDYPPVDAFVARVEQMWEEAERGREHEVVEMRMMIRARWYFKKEDVLSLRGTLNGPISRQQLLTAMTNRDVLLSDQVDVNDVLTVLGKCIVLKRQPTGKHEPDPRLPERTFVCKYGINFGSSAPGTALLTPIETGNDEWPTSELNLVDNTKAGKERNLSRKRLRVDSDVDAPLLQPTTDVNLSSKNDTRSISLITSGSFSRDDTVSKSAEASAMSSESDSDTSTSTFFRNSESEETPPQTEGSTTMGQIKVGPNHQVLIPLPPTGEQQLLRTSRNPTMVWKRNAIQDDILDDFFSQAGVILTGYLKKNGLLLENPYTPFPQARAEAKLKADGGMSPLTISRVSTACSLSTVTSKLTRECKVDSLLEILQKNHYDTKAALEVITESPRDFVKAFTRSDKELFDHGFRRYSGSLRMISKNVEFSKGIKDVVDYHYRFKIPDQFRRYQEKKREQATRMMEVIENRRYYDNIVTVKSEKTALNREGPNSSVVNNSGSNATKQGVHNWNKTSTSDMVDALEERRSLAKSLLLEVQKELGEEKLALVARALGSYHAIPEVKEDLEELLEDHPEFLGRFMEFLPKRFRNMT